MNILLHKTEGNVYFYYAGRAMLVLLLMKKRFKESGYEPDLVTMTPSDQGWQIAVYDSKTRMTLYFIITTKIVLATCYKEQQFLFKGHVFVEENNHIIEEMING